MIKKAFIIFLIASSITPHFSMAAALDYSGFVKCDGVKAPVADEPKRQTECDFNALLDTIKLAINWLFVITIPIVTVLFAYAGFLYMTGSQGNIKTAKSIFTSAATGFIIMLIAWFAVITVINWFITDTSKAVVNTFVDTKK